MGISLHENKEEKYGLIVISNLLCHDCTGPVAPKKKKKNLTPMT